MKGGSLLPNSNRPRHLECQIELNSKHTENIQQFCFWYTFFFFFRLSDTKSPTKPKHMFTIPATVPPSQPSSSCWRFWRTSWWPSPPPSSSPPAQQHSVQKNRVLCTGAFLYAPYSLLFISDKFWMGEGRGWGGRSSAVMLLYRTGGGGGLWEQCGKTTLHFEFFGPQMALAYRLDAIPQDPKTALYESQLPSCPFLFPFCNVSKMLHSFYLSALVCVPYPAIYSLFVLHSIQSFSVFICFPILFALLWCTLSLPDPALLPLLIPLCNQSLLALYPILV